MPPRLPELRDFAARYTLAWCSQNPESVAAFFSPDGSLRVNDDPPAVGRNAITQVAQSFMVAFPDLSVMMDDLILRRDVVEYHWTLTGTNTGPGGTGHSVRISGLETWRFGCDGLVASSHGHFDVAEYRRQLQEGIQPGSSRPSETMSIRFIDQAEVARRLTYDLCLPIVHDAMIAFSRGETRQILRSILPLSEGRVFGVMPGALGPHAPFGAKLISVFQGNSAQGKQSHQGLVILFDPQSGAPVCIVHAGEITAIRTAAASAVATAALARPDAHRLALIGCGEQAATHLRAIAQVRKVEAITVWGRSPVRARAFTERNQIQLGIPILVATSVEEAVAKADIICTLTSATEPVLKGAWVRPGTHLNLVGSGYAGPTEVDNDLVVRSRFIADSREGILRQGAEFLRAKEAGLIGDDHIVAEIGQVLSGEVEGRRSPDEITVYKSIGHVVQDLATAWALYSQPEQKI
jgi:ornithine cyclodeaminase/alanine dehydrogenase-like protein (mu-crystallin family)